MHRHDLSMGILSLVTGLLGIPAVVLTGERLWVSALLAVAATVSGLWAMRSPAPAAKALSIAGFVLGVLSLWYVLTGWVIGWSLAEAIESLF